MYMQNSHEVSGPSEKEQEPNQQGKRILVELLQEDSKRAKESYAFQEKPNLLNTLTNSAEEQQETERVLQQAVERMSASIKIARDTVASRPDEYAKPVEIWADILVERKDESSIEVSVDFDAKASDGIVRGIEGTGISHLTNLRDGIPNRERAERNAKVRATTLARAYLKAGQAEHFNTHINIKI